MSEKKEKTNKIKKKYITTFKKHKKKNTQKITYLIFELK